MKSIVTIHLSFATCANEIEQYYQLTAVPIQHFRLMDLQTMDYLPVLSRIEEESFDGREQTASRIYGSELLKESLAQDSTDVPEMQKPIETKEKRKFIFIGVRLKIIVTFSHFRETTRPSTTLYPYGKTKAIQKPATYGIH